MRAFAIENALYWLREYRFDGLRLDAVHAISEPGEVSMLHDLSRAVGESGAPKPAATFIWCSKTTTTPRACSTPSEDPPRGKYRAQWNDDYHHAWHVLLTGETQGYYGDYAKSPLRDIARALASGFVYQGEASAHRDGQLRGEPSGALAPTAFVNFLQNHDQIGNRALGDRLESIAKPKAIEAALAITLLAPMPYRCCSWARNGARKRHSRSSAISRAISPRPCARAGARNSPAPMPKYGDEVPDPLDESTFQSAVLDWESRNDAAASRRLKLVQDLLAIRRREIIPRLAGAAFGAAHATDDGLLTAQWRMADGTTLSLLANLSDRDIARPAGESKGTLIWGTELKERIPPWSVFSRIG